ncbi:MAG: VCBS repeat-containing protein [Bryobacterales bacterium]|nr:VCBS repeat-containing protein [Bryobacterales bacterium]
MTTRPNRNHRSGRTRHTWQRLFRTAALLFPFLLISCGADSPETSDSAAQTAKRIPSHTQPWARHTIDTTSDGADGVRLADANGDGLPDIVTGWEEGGIVRVYLHPGAARVREAWPYVTIGSVGSPEDAVFADLDGDGNLDVITSAEGKARQVMVHWAPARERLLEEKAWEMHSLPSARDRMQWMFALPLQIDGKHGIDFFAGGKNQGAEVGWFQAPATPRRLDDWVWRPLRKVGWLMSLVAADMDGDGDEDLLLTDRTGPGRGVLWLENPGEEAVTGIWKEHTIGSVGEDEVMFLAYGDIDGDGLDDIVSAVKPQHLHIYRRLDAQGRYASPITIPLPAEAGTAKGIAIGDIDGDGLADLVFSCEHARDGKPGVMGLRAVRAGDGLRYEPFPISGPAGVKFDLVQLVDLDGDGDLDVLTCEETDNLGVIWYENPRR